MSALRCLSRCLALVLLASRATPAVATPPVPAAAPPVTLPPSGGDLDLSLGIRAQRGDFRSGHAGFVSLTVPLERFAAPRKLTAAPQATDPTGESGLDAPPGPADPNVESQAEAAEVAPALEPALTTAALARFARETLAAARRTHGVGAQRRELDGISSRARSSAWLPELRLRATRSDEDSLRLTPTAEDPYRYTLAGGTDLVLEASATWRLNRLVFADEEIPVERLVLERERGTEKLTAHVLERLFAWHRALSRLSAASPKERGRLELELAEAAVELDVLTGGWFSDQAFRPAPGGRRGEPQSGAEGSRARAQPSRAR